MTSLPHHSPAVTTDVPRDGSGAGLVIDWPTPVQADSDALADYLSSFVDWVETLPRQSNVHVRLPSVRHRTSLRRLQRTLQTMGCTVTCRMQLSH